MKYDVRNADTLGPAVERDMTYDEAVLACARLNAKARAWDSYTVTSQEQIRDTAPVMSSAAYDELAALTDSLHDESA